jgi:hypothetical protein
MSKVRDFISLIIQAARACAIKVGVEEYRHGSGAMIASLEIRDSHVDLDRFLIEITSLADQDHMGLQLSINSSNVLIKNEFQRHGFFIIDDEDMLQMERNPQGLRYEELEFMESAPPGKKAARFLKHRKADFKKRYGKNWKQVLYATAWKQFGESQTFKDYFSLIEHLDEK